MTPEEFAQQADVSRETLARLLAFDALLLERLARHNLIARSTVEIRWRRHYLDSAQLFPLIPRGARTLVDLGSGAGFPGLILAAMGAPGGLQAALIESTGKKAAFLAEAVRAMDLTNVRVLPVRIESAQVAPPDVITARALSATVKLCAYAHGIAGRNTTFLFPKGVRVEDELTEARKSWRMDVTRHKSITDADAAILEIRNLAPR